MEEREISLPSAVMERLAGKELVEITENHRSGDLVYRVGEDYILKVFCLTRWELRLTGKSLEVNFQILIGMRVRARRGIKMKNRRGWNGNETREIKGAGICKQFEKQGIIRVDLPD